MSLNMLSGIIVLGIVLIFVGFNVKNYLAEQQTLRELDTVGKDLRVIYDKILEANKGNVESSDFSKVCSESSVEVGRGQITCSIGGTIIIKQELDIDKAGKILNDSVKMSIIDAGNEVIFYSGKYDSGASIEMKALYSGVRCVADYGKIPASKQWSFSLICARSVPDVLPGYTLKN